MPLHKQKPRTHILNLLSALVLSVSALSFSTHAIANEKTTQQKPPKLVVVLVVDGLPYEQLVRYRDQFGQGGFRRLLENGASFSNAHQAHGITTTCIGHAAILTGAYPYQHGIIANTWTAPSTTPDAAKSVYCAEDTAYQYISEDTKPADGTAPTKLRSSTLGDELRYATGNQSKVIAISGKDRGAIMLAGRNGTAYMFMSKTGNFASSTYYMAQHPDWVKAFNAAKPQDQFYGSNWTPLLKEQAYANDAAIAPIAAAADKHDEDAPPPAANTLNGKPVLFAFTMDSKSGKPEASYYKKLQVSPYIDELSLQFAKAAVDGEQLGNNPKGATDILAVSLSNHDYINHGFGPESRMSHDHLQRLDRMLAAFFQQINQKVGLDNALILLTADHGFANTPEFALASKADAGRVDTKKLVEVLNQHLNEKFGLDKAIVKTSLPALLLDYAQIQAKGLKRDDVETVAARFALNYPGIAQTYTRTQMETGSLPNDRMAKLMQRGWNRQLSGDIILVTKPYWIFSSTTSGTSHGTPYSYDTNVPLLIMGKPWIKPGFYPNYVEIVDIAPTLAHLLKVRQPSASEGRILEEVLK
jgi:predicted AlkP superfamily pyrophosphatase or phosphodiesterase